MRRVFSLAAVVLAATAVAGTTTQKVSPAAARPVAAAEGSPFLLLPYNVAALSAHPAASAAIQAVASPNGLDRELPGLPNPAGPNEILPSAGNAASIWDEQQSGVFSDPVEQWLRSEQLENAEQFRQETRPISVEIVHVKVADVVIQTLDSISPTIRDAFLRDDHVVWPKHPYNSDARVPHASDDAAGHWTGRFTASRSLAFPQSLGVTVKTPTNRVAPRNWSVSKASTRQSIRTSVPRSAHIESVDEALRPDPRLLILKDVLSVADRRTGNGFIVRDISALLAGRHYYFPAFSIPYAGSMIANANAASFKEFWAEHYAKALGQAKAKLLLRYGLQMATPNAQNFLIELDARLKPTGTIVFRDLGDTDFVRSVAEALGFAKRPDKSADDDSADEDAPFPDPHGEQSFLYFDQADALANRELVLEWRRIHDKAYVDSLVSELSISAHDAGALLGSLPPFGFTHGIHFGEYFEGPLGRRALVAYRQRAIH